MKAFWQEIKIGFKVNLVRRMSYKDIIYKSYVFIKIT